MRDRKPRGRMPAKIKVTVRFVDADKSTYLPLIHAAVREQIKRELAVLP